MRVIVTRKDKDVYRAAGDFTPGTLVESRNGNQYLVMTGERGQTVLVSLVNNKVYGTDKTNGAGGSLSYKEVPYSYLTLEAE